jgi:hypothetical protein
MNNLATINGASINGAGSPQVRALAASFLGAPTALARVYPAPALDIADGIARYYCTLTGSEDSLDDVVLPISSFSVRHRTDSASYYSLVIPSYDYVGAIAARPNGQIVLTMDTDGTVEELARGSLGDVRTDRGPRSQSISISGNASRAATTPATYVLPDALYAYTTFDGESRLRIKPRAAMRPGDTVRYKDVFFEVNAVSWSVSVQGATMEIATA